MTLENARKLQDKWAKHVGAEIVATNTIGMKLVLIPAGEFSMGSNVEILIPQLAEFAKKGEKQLLSPDYLKMVMTEAPAHHVRLTRPYYIGMHEVTMGQFKQFVDAANYQTEVEKLGKGSSRAETGRDTVRDPRFTWKNPGVARSDLHPVCNVNWADAQAFCGWLSKREGKRYRLPTEAEWEYACRAGSTTAWSFGDDVRNARDRMWCYFPKNVVAGAGAHAVGGKKNNEFGLHDMHGNVEEMCADFWGPAYYKNSPLENPAGPDADFTGKKMARGGSFLEIPFACGSSYRNALNPALGYVQVGFRVVCEIPLGPE